MRIMESSSQKHVCAVGRTEARLVTGSQNDTIPVAGAPGISVVTLGGVPQPAIPAETGCLSGMGCGGRASCTMRGSGGKVQLWTRSTPPTSLVPSPEAVPMCPHQPR